MEGWENLKLTRFDQSLTCDVMVVGCRPGHCLKQNEVERHQLGSDSIIVKIQNVQPRRISFSCQAIFFKLTISITPVLVPQSFPYKMPAISILSITVTWYIARLRRESSNIGMSTLTTQLLKWSSFKNDQQHDQGPPEADVDDGVVRLAPHRRPLVMREVVHLKKVEDHPKLW